MSKVLIAILILSCAAPAFADDPTPKLEHKQPDAVPPPKPATEYKANAQVGFLMVKGNAESIGLSGSGLFAVKHYNNAFEAAVQGAYAFAGSSSVKGGPIDHHATAAENWLWRLRYDRFLSEMNSLFLTYSMSGDKLAGYVYRIEPQIGYSRIFFKSIHQRLSADFGYDYTYDHYLPGSTPRSLDFHSLRLFVGYENKLTQYATFTEGFELLWAVNDTDNLDHVRINSLTSLSATVTKRVSLKLNLTLKANLHPPDRPLDMSTMPATSQGQYEKLDSILEAVLAVTFL